MKPILLHKRLFVILLCLVFAIASWAEEKKDTLTLEVCFRVNKTDIDLQYMGNEAKIEQFVSSIRKRCQDSNLQLQHLVVQGTASPEGDYANNQRLSRGRAHAVAALIANRLSLPDSVLIEQPQGENWEGLFNFLQQSDSQYSEKVIYILHGNLKNLTLQQSNLLKRKIKQIDNGITWGKLKREVFPYLRNANNQVVLTFNEPTPIPSDTIPTDTVAIDTIPVEPAEPVVPTLPQEPYIIEDIVNYRRELLSIKSNLLFDFAYVPFGYDRFCPIPNVAIEYYPRHGHFTYGASFDGPWWQHRELCKYFQVRNYQLHTRYYLRSGDETLRRPGEGAAFKGLYLSAYAHAGLYSICINEKHGYEGEGFGAGLGIGYVLPLGKSEHWRLEFGLQAGWIHTQQDPYQWLCPVDPENDLNEYYYKWYGKSSDFVRRQHKFNWIGPTRVEITLSYDLLYRRAENKGISFRAKEQKRKEVADVLY